jgi:hypothetical protein
MPLVATSQKTHVLPIKKKWKIHFLNGKSKNPSYKSCWQWKDAHHCQKWGQDSKVCYITCTNQAQLGRKPSEVLLGGIFCEEFFYNTLVCHVWYILRYYITYHDSMHWFSIFLIFLNFLCPHFKSRSNSRCLQCVLGWWGLPSFGWVLGFHTFMAHPGIFPQIF